MAHQRALSMIRLVNGSVGDPVLYLDYPGTNNALLFDGGDNYRLSMKQLGDLEAMFITHHHVDHFIGLDRVIRANIDRDKELQIYGPAGTITKIYDRIRSYEYRFFPFQKLAVVVTELLPGRRRRGRLECTRRFPPPEITEEAWTTPTCHENEELTVEAVAVEHTVPCLAYAMAEKPGYHPDSERLQNGLLKPGRWVGEVLHRLRSGASLESRLEIQGGSFTLGTLAETYFARSSGARVAFITDTFWSEATRPDLVRLSRGAWRLYCDSFYASAQTREAAKHKHMQAPQAATLAKLARVDELILMHFSPRYADHYEKLIAEAAAIFPRVRAELEVAPEA
jgi:ribonuclease Z